MLRRGMANRTWVHFCGPIGADVRSFMQFGALVTVPLRTCLEIANFWFRELT
jgi:hypothetical protein